LHRPLRITTARELAEVLRRELGRAAKGERVVTIHLFGIRHAVDLRTVSIPEVLEIAGVPGVYVTEVHKGMKLADYVEIKGT
jgi:hypothetical protein